MNRRVGLDELDGIIASKDPDYFGGIGPYGVAGPSILIIDDRADVIGDLIAALNQGEEINARFFFFQVADKDGARTGDLLEWIDKKRPFAGIYIDGDLGGQADGMKTAGNIREITGMRYQPMAILTAEMSWVKQVGSKSIENLPIMLKFETDSHKILNRLSVELENLRNMVRDRMWRDLQFEVATALEDGDSAEELANLVGRFLEIHDGVKAWYLRDLIDDTMRSIAMKDAYQSGREMHFDDTSAFLRDLVLGKTDKPWIARNRLAASDAEPRQVMVGDHCIAAALGGRFSRYKGSLTVYRPKEEQEFEERDARELHHVALQIRSAIERENSLERQENTARTIEAIMMARDSVEATNILRDFVHEEVNSAPGARGKSKTSVRLFLRGSGDLHRWGYDKNGRETCGELGGKENANDININDKKSVYARVIINRKTERNDDRKKIDHGFVSTVKGVRSYLTVPIMHGNAVLGAVNLEANYPNAYKEYDEKLVEAMATATAASIFRQRADRFMGDLARLAALAVRPSAANVAMPKEILAQAAKAVYHLCGYSNLILVEPPSDTDDLDIPWTIVAGWRGGKVDPTIDDAEALEHWERKLAVDWEKNYLKKVLSSTGTKSGLFRSNDLNDIRRVDGEGDIRPTGRPTLSQLVIRIGKGKNPNSLISMLFEHPWPIPESTYSALEAFAEFMSAIYEADQHKLSRFGESLVVQRHEARIGRQFGQLRHSINGQLAKIKSIIKLDLARGKAPESILEGIQRRLARADEVVKATSALVKTPQIEVCSPQTIWNELIREEADRARVLGIRLLGCEGEKSILADVDILKTVLFNLLDNALIHGVGVSLIKMGINRGKISICDDGEPIVASNRDHIFEPGFTTSSEGTGQGLYYSREIISDMNGRLSFKLVDNRNCFFISLPEVDK